MLRQNLSLGGVVLLSALCVAVSARPAQACGGFFCSQQPVDQSAERILFALSPNKVTAHIQINYQGAADKFSWIVPVQAIPNIKLGSQTVFTQLDSLTRPQFRTDMAGLGGSCFGRAGAGASDAGLASPASEGVNVIDAKQVGPFDTVTLQSKSTEELTKWLANNGYTQPPTALPLIDHYVKLGMYFVAVKLTKSATVGEIAPLVLEMDVGEACVPLVLTQIAAVPDMPVIVYVLGAARAFPRNWFHVTLDLAQIDWLTGGSNYQQIANAAINEAAGHGFITEFAGKASAATNLLYSPGRYNTTPLVGQTDPVQVVNLLTSSSVPRDAVLPLLRQFVPMPASLVQRGVSEPSFYNAIFQYTADLAGFQVDSVGLVKAIEDRVITPLREAQALVDAHPYLTRLMSTVSPDEMNRDPLFLLNPDLADVPNVHTAKVSGMCQSSGTISNMKLTLEDGRVLSLGDTPLFGAPRPWPYANLLPRAKTIELLGTSGGPVRIKRTEVNRIDGELNRETADVVRARVVTSGAVEPPKPLTNPPPANEMGKDSGCSFGGGDAAAGWLTLLAGLASAFAWSRRKRSHNL